MGAVIGRSDDLRAIAQYLEVAGTRPSALLIDGEAGIGKSTLWVSALERAAEVGFHTVSASASKAETEMEYGTVADLLGEIDREVLVGMPEAQLSAIDHVTLRDTTDISTPELPVVAAALMSVIQKLSRNAPVLIGIDDVQWLDHCSRAVIADVARRLRQPAALVLTERPELGHASAMSWLEPGLPNAISRIRVGPMSMAELHELLSARLRRSFPRPTMRRIAKVSAGNPFYALELARFIDDGLTGAEPDLPRTLAELVRIRMEDLSQDTRQVLLAAACVTDPTVGALARATGSPIERTMELLDAAVRQGVVAIDGDRVRYCHPLLARGVYTTTAPAQRRAMHRTLADVVTQPELKVRHMALAASAPDPELLHALDEVADVARARGAAADAAELLDLAIKLGGDTPSRRTRSAENHLRAGDSMRARDLLATAIEQLPPGPQRALALNLLAGAWVFDSSVGEATDLLKRAVADAEGSPLILLQALLALAFTQSIAGDYDEALRVSKHAIMKAEELGVPALISQALANYVTINALDGNGVDTSALDRALELEDPDLDAAIVFHARAAEAQVLAWTGRLDEASLGLQVLRRRCIEHRADGDLSFVSVHTALVDIWRGRIADAAQVAEEGLQLAEQIGGEHMVSIAKTIRAAAAAYAGREHDARADIAGAMAAVEHCGTPGLAYWPMSVLGFLEVSLGNYAEAATALNQLCRDFPDMPGTEIITASFVPDAAEALIALGRREEAEPLIKALEHNGQLFDRPWMLAVGARCRAMMLAAQGEVEAAEQSVRAALTEYLRLPMPFERARTQLLHGQLQRSRRDKTSAATTLGEALRAFEDMGAPLWAARAHAELGRTMVAETHGDLTPSEQRVAELAAMGMTSAAIASRLCVSAKTVDASLTRVYRKLDIHSRAELGGVMAASGQ
jgi:DNA-binding NarL/FixJ family response regulator